MSAHLTDELPRLLTGEASREVVLSAAQHLRICVDCQQELVSAVVAHASLTSAQRFAPEIVARPTASNFAREQDDDADDHDQPDLSAVFAQIRQEAADGFRPDREPRATSHSRRYLAVAAAAVVLVGGGFGIYAATSGSDTTTAGRTVALAAYDHGTTSATAQIDNSTIQLSAASLPRLTNKRYEVWLTDSGRTRMQPIGWLGNDGKAVLTVPSNLMSEYQDLEVSVQDVGASDYAYSGTSVLRGSFS